MQEAHESSDSPTPSSLALSTSTSSRGEMQRESAEPAQGRVSLTGSQQALLAAQDEPQQAQQPPRVTPAMQPRPWGPEALLHLSLNDSLLASASGSPFGPWQGAAASAAPQQPPSPEHEDPQPDWTQLLRSTAQHAPGVAAVVLTHCCLGEAKNNEPTHSLQRHLTDHSPDICHATTQSTMPTC